MTLGLASCGGGDDDGGAPAREGSSPHESGEKSVEGFGEEAAGSGREQVLAAERAYLEAVASRDYATACARLSLRTQESLASFAGKRVKSTHCEEILPALLAPSAAAISRQQARGRVTRVRIDGGEAFVIFHAPGAKLYVFTLGREGGDWKATRVSASILVPLPAVPE